MSLIRNISNRPLGKLKLYLILICGLLTCTPASSDTQESDPQDSGDELWMDQILPDLYYESKDPIYQRGHQTLSEGLMTFSESIDSFFSEPRMDVEANGTRLRVNGRSIFVDREPEQYQFDINFNLDLPNTKKRLNLIFLSLSEDLDESEDDNDTGAQSPQDSVENQDYFAGLRLFLEQNKNINVSTDYGVKLTLPLDPFARVRARESIFIKNWELRLTQNLFWFQQRGLGARANIDFDRPVYKGLLFRQANRASWLRDEEEIRYSHSLNLFHSISTKAGWVYSTGINSDSPDNEQPTLQAYFVSARYRRNIYRNALFFEATPFVTWSRGNNFTYSPGIVFNLQILFGPKYMRPTEVDYL